MDFLVAPAVMPTGTSPTDPNGNYEPGNYSIRWEVEDCDGQIVCDVTFAVADQQAPLFTCPLNVTVNCATDVLPPFSTLTEFLAEPGANAGDDCTELDDLMFQFIDEVNDPGCPGSVRRQYLLTDEAGMFANCFHTITVDDSTDPTFDVPADITINADNTCSINPDPLITGVPTNVMDNCPVPVTIDMNDVANMTGCSVGSNVTGTITRTWTITDGCNHVVSQDQIITIIDNIPPTYTVPIDITIFKDPNPANNCSFDASVAVTGDVIDEADNCGVTFEASFLDNVSANNPCTGSTIITRIWNLTDNCGNSNVQNQTITVQDNTPPTFTRPADISIDTDALCMADTSTGNTGDVTDELDNCDTAINATFSDVVANNTPCTGQQIITRTWSLSDACGNSAADQIQTITVEDNIAPTFTVPANITISSTSSCNFDASVGITGDVTDEADNCTPSGSLDATFSDLTVSDTPCTGSFILTRTWSLVDACGNPANDQIQTITVEDVTPPTFTGPADITIFKDAMCNHDAAINITGEPTMLDDNCDMMLMATFVDLVSTNTPCVGAEVISRTWSLVDACGNPAVDHLQTITVSDISSPTFSAPANITISCTQDQNDLNITGDVIDEADNCSTGIQASSSDNIVAGTCAGMYLIERTWSLVDLCSNAAIDQVQMIMVQDLVDPVVTCSDVITSTVPTGACSATITVPPPTVVETCGGFTVVNDFNNTADASDTYPVGTTTVIWTVTDDCGNIGTCSFDIIVSDEEDPNITANNAVCVVLGGAGTATLSTGDIVVAVTDNCSVASVQIARMEPNGGPCNIVGNDVLGDNVSFCCADAGSSINVMIEAVDIYGNDTQLMVAIPVKETVLPTTTCPSDVTINCEFPLDYNDLSTLGNIVIDPATPNDIIINGMVVGTDGVASDNCGISDITYVVDDSGLSCNQGPIIRTFTITDNSMNTTSCTQIITVQDDDLFDEMDITWPADFNLTDCNNLDNDPMITGMPIFPIDKCSQVAASHSDASYQDPPINACPFFLRTWTVIDWCQYIPNNPASPGVWTYVQTITALNNVAPVFSNCADVTICANETTCIGNLSHSISATDDCTDTPELAWSYSFDLFGNGTTVYAQNDSTLVGNYPQGVHTLTWTVEDNCGNANTCVQNVTIIDCKAPSVVCLNGISVSLNQMASGGMVELWASDLDASTTDNCTAYNDLIFSFSSNTAETNKMFTCADLGQQDIEIWVTDAAGNQAACNTYVIVQDNSNICPPPTTATATVAGRMSSEMDMGISNTEVKISSNNMTDHFMTDTDGEFMFPNLNMHKDYTVTPYKNDNHINGVSTIDLVLIQKHILGLKDLDSPYKLIAADVNNSKSLSAIDLIQIRKLILGLIDEFPASNSWKFIPGDFVFNDPSHPWNFVEETGIEDIDANVWNLDFVAVKMGDVNATVENLFQKVDLSSRDDDQKTIKFDNQEFVANEELKVPVKMIESSSMLALQFTHSYDASLLEFVGIESVALNVNPSDYTELSAGEVTFTWYDTKAINTDQTLFNLVYKTKKRGDLIDAIEINSTRTEAQIYTEEEETFGLNSRFDLPVSNEMQVFQNTPNPFSEQTAIEIHLSKAENTSLRVYDSQGSLVYNRVFELDRGINIVGISKADLKGGSGIYFYEINTGRERSTQKMIVL